MSNDYFQFKQFLIKQDKCAMKVCTDACLFGAWTAEAIGKSKEKIQHVLDIGCGTGLLSLMLAQKLPNAIIDAVEIDEAAAQQAKENFQLSKWNGRLHAYTTSIQQFDNSAIRQFKYDLIISNPPFYENDLKSKNSKRNLALHSSDLRLEELIFIADNLLADEGNFFVLVPYHRTEIFTQLIQEKLFIKEQVFLKQTTRHTYFRTMFWLTKQNTAMHQSEIIIINNKNEYSSIFKSLLKDYYLAL